LPAGTSPPQILLISVDPERDSPRVLKEYTGHFGSGVSGASGDIEQLRKLTTPLGIYFAKDFSAGQDYTMSHSAAVLFINDKAEFKAVFNAPLNIDKLVADLSMLVTGH
jgi:protein SCO1/2